MEKPGGEEDGADEVADLFDAPTLFPETVEGHCGRSRLHHSVDRHGHTTSFPPANTARMSTGARRSATIWCKLLASASTVQSAATPIAWPAWVIALTLW